MQLSANNPKIKLVSQLKEKKFRDAEGLFIAEGEHVVEEAIKRGAAIEFVVYSEGFGNKELTLRIANSFYLTDRDFKKISDTESPKGIIAVVRKPCLAGRQAQHAVSGLFEGESPFFMICDGIQDPGNLGTMIRSAAAAGCSGVAVSNNSVDPYNPKVVRGSGGCIFSIPVVAEVKVLDVLKAAKDKKVKTVAADASSKKTIYEADLKAPLALVIGSEGAGSSSDILSACDEPVSIPMKKDVESLNAAVSAAVILFEAVRQRGRV